MGNAMLAMAVSALAMRYGVSDPELPAHSGMLGRGMTVVACDRSIFGNLIPGDAV
jgi:hypothetical protein